MNETSSIPGYRPLAILALVLFSLALVDGLLPQLQIVLLGGHIVVTNAVFMLFILLVLIFGCIIHPRIKLEGIPIFPWLLCIGFLIADMPHLIFAHGMSLTDVLMSYSEYYLLLLAGPAALAFRDTFSDRVVVRYIAILLLICAVIGIAQYLTQQPILHTESSDGKFEVYSSEFNGDRRAFSLFTSGLGFGLFCSLGGALGIALFRTRPKTGVLILALSGLGCFSTLTRLSYLVFFCACIYSLVLTFGKRPKRGLWLPLIFLVLGIAVILSGLRSSLNGSSSNLQDTGSLFERVENWTYYFGLYTSSPIADKLLGAGTTLNQKNTMPIDNVPLALIMHIGLIGSILFAILLFRMWLYLRREALVARQPFLIAAASLWATLTCAGIFNIILIQLGAIFAIAILCKKGGIENSQELIEGNANN